MNRIKLFKEYRNLPDDYKKRVYDNESKVDILPNDPSVAELTAVVFAPDPVTGLPSSDIARIMASDTNPQVAQYIRDNLMSPNPNYQPGVDDPDLALEFIPRDGENFEQFSSRLRASTQQSYEEYMRAYQEPKEPSASAD